MPKIYEYLGIIFRFWSDDHSPIHVHAKKFVDVYKNEILNDYIKIFVLNKKIKCKKITQKIK